MIVGHATSLEQNRLPAGSGAPGCLVCTRQYPVCTGQCSVPWLEHFINWPLSSFLRASPLKITRLSCEPSVQRSTVGLRPQSAAPEVRRQSVIVRLHQTVRCATGLFGAPRGQTT
jgi:hypothetical protein